MLAAASALDLRRWIAEIDAPSTDVARELALAGRRAAALTEREGKVFLAVRALDNVAADDEVGKVVLHAAVALPDALEHGAPERLPGVAQDLRRKPARRMVR